MTRMNIWTYRDMGMTNKEVADYLTAATGTRFNEYDPNDQVTFAAVHATVQPGEFGKILLTLSSQFDTMVRTTGDQTSACVWLDLRGLFFRDKILGKKSN